MGNIIIELFPTADRFLEALDVERERAILRRIVEYCADQMHPMITRAALCNQLYETGGYVYDHVKKIAVEKAFARTWKALEDAGLIEEPDPMNGKNGYRVPAPAGVSAATTPDLAAIKVVARFTRDMFHPFLPDAAWNAFRSGDYDSAVFESFKAVEVTVRSKGLGKNGIHATSHGDGLMRDAFNPDVGPLTDMKATRGRRERRRELFTGAFGELRNPKAHSDPTITDPLIAVEEMMIAGALQRIVDSA